LRDRTADGRPRRSLGDLEDLPEREREEFLRQYHQAVDAAHDRAGYQQLRRLLRVWSLTAIAAGQPGYYEELEAVCDGTATTDRAGHRRDTGLDRTGRRSQEPTLTYRAELSGRALKQIYGLPGQACDSLVEAMAEVG